ncbi:hypothetical protein [Sphingopyxis sp.]|uniref:hypothetical protein n=1 Tax=Sphingopyxis sp. TaxID=1908224 RepID=UPI003D6CB638
MGINSTRAPDGATTFTNQADPAIIAAFDRRATAFLAVRALPDDPTARGETDEQSAQWAIVDAAEKEICNAVAATPRGAELQLWTAVVYLFTDAEDEAPCFRADLGWFNAKFDRLDWQEKLTVAALRSLREIGGAA